MATYAEAMAHAYETYRDVIEALRAVEVPADITQTGGMCLAIEWNDPAARGYYFLTDIIEPLPWERSELSGWAIGFYATDNDDCPEAPPDWFGDGSSKVNAPDWYDGPMSPYVDPYRVTNDTSPQAAVTLALGAVRCVREHYCPECGAELPAPVRDDAHFPDDPEGGFMFVACAADDCEYERVWEVTR